MRTASFPFPALYGLVLSATPASPGLPAASPNDHAHPLCARPLPERPDRVIGRDEKLFIVHMLRVPCAFVPFPHLYPVRLEELGGSHVLCGLARLIMCVSEVPFFYLSGPLIRRLGVRGVIALAQLAYLTRFFYYSVRLACTPIRLSVETRHTPILRPGARVLRKFHLWHLSRAHLVPVLQLHAYTPKEPTAYNLSCVLLSAGSPRAVVGAPCGGIAWPHLCSHVGGHHRLRSPNRSRYRNSRALLLLTESRSTPCFPGSLLEYLAPPLTVCGDLILSQLRPCFARVPRTVLL